MFQAFQKFREWRTKRHRLAIYKELYRVNREGGEREVISFAGHHFYFPSLIQRIHGAASCEIALFLVSLTHYYPNEAPRIAKDLAENIGDEKRLHKIIDCIKQNKRHPEAATLLFGELLLLP